MVHLEDVLGLTATKILLGGWGELAELPVVAVVLDPNDPERLIRWVRPLAADQNTHHRFTDFCRYFHEHVPGGEALCRRCDTEYAWRALDNRWTEAHTYQCYMGLSEFVITLRAAGDLSDPIICGQSRLPDARIEQRINELKKRVEKVAPDEVDKITDEHLQGLRDRIPSIPVWEQDKCSALCRRLTAGAKGLEQLLQTEHHISRTLHRIKGSLNPARGTVDRIIAIIATPQVGRSPEEIHAFWSSLRKHCRNIEEDIEDARLRIVAFERSRSTRGGMQRPLSRKWHPLRHLSERATRRIRFEADERRIDVRMHGAIGDAPKNPYVNVDWESMMELFDLLLDNALKYSENGRPIGVYWRTIRAAPARLPARQSPSGKGPWLEIVVEDYGLQIHPDDREKIFEPGIQGRLFAPRRSITGAGMGLTFAKEIVLQHGGYINVWCDLFGRKIDAAAGSGGEQVTPPGKVLFTVGLPGNCFRKEKPI